MIRIPGYELRKHADEGGMAIVFRGTHRGREVAVKVLRPELVGNDAAASRFAREARSVAELAHPGIVRLVGSGVVDDGRPFVAYEWLDGPTLSAFGPCSTRQAASLAGAMLKAIAAAHDLGWVHRDLTPRNVIVANGEPKLIDFGLVNSLARSVPGETWTRLTRTGFVVGTPPYMAPEQIEGEAVGVGADIWAIGVMIYWLVSGREPFVAKTPTLRMLKVVSKRERPLQNIASWVHSSLAAVVHRALEKEPSQRWPSARAMAAALAKAQLSDHAPEGVGQLLGVTRTRKRP